MWLLRPAIQLLFCFLFHFLLANSWLGYYFFLVSMAKSSSKLLRKCEKEIYMLWEFYMLQYCKSVSVKFQALFLIPKKVWGLAVRDVSLMFSLKDQCWLAGLWLTAPQFFKKFYKVINTETKQSTTCVQYNLEKNPRIKKKIIFYVQKVVITPLGLFLFSLSGFSSRDSSQG